ncbi:hypothetical protein F0L17_18675 [Streptomyces sp. TRM43335]|uniref:Uncharacterized protein n=1 Tax=Streptomyces taklimakanensis TaxID=2569853 RepID=A0A6G2BG58_9ACTN|nr:hypothetical protein [Streptomyces taklimakanensis]MTE21106.1 hypothetical protein [Streptomyces taklimakanensis]
MSGKKMEGDEDQKRATAREAERAGRRPSERSDTTGASKQRTHLTGRSTITHEERLETRDQGKQGRRGTEATDSRTAGETGRTFTGRGAPEYGERHERVFRALTAEEERHPGEPVHLQDVSRAAELPQEETRVLLHDLVAVHKLVTEVQGDSAGLGPRYETKSRR